jgi:hypothetical protein
MGDGGWTDVVVEGWLAAPRGEAVHPFVTFWEGTTTPYGRRDARLHRILRRVNGEMEGAVCAPRTRERRYTRYCRAVVTAARVEKLVSVSVLFEYRRGKEWQGKVQL